MIVTVMAHKGGVCKTTTAVHLAAWFALKAPTVLLDADPTRNALGWASRGMDRQNLFGPGLVFPVLPITAAARVAGRYTHLVCDTGQKPSLEDLKDNAAFSDLVIVPAVPTALDTDGLQQTLRDLQQLGVTNYAVLLTRVGPDMAAQAQQLREMLAERGARIFRAEIPRLKAYEKAAAEGVVVSAAVDARQGERAWAAYAAVGEEMLA